MKTEQHIVGIDGRALRAFMQESGLDRDDIADLLAVFLVEAPGRVHAVREAALAGDPAALATAAHALKSPAAVLCAPRLAEILERVEDEARDGGIANVDFIDAVQAEVGRIAEQADAA